MKLNSILIGFITLGFIAIGAVVITADIAEAGACEGSCNAPPPDGCEGVTPRGACQLACLSGRCHHDVGGPSAGAGIDCSGDGVCNGFCVASVDPITGDFTSLGDPDCCVDTRSPAFFICAQLAPCPGEGGLFIGCATGRVCRLAANPYACGSPTDVTQNACFNVCP